MIVKQNLIDVYKDVEQCAAIFVLKELCQLNTGILTTDLNLSDRYNSSNWLFINWLTFIKTISLCALYFYISLNNIIPHTMHTVRNK